MIRTMKLSAVRSLFLSLSLLLPVQSAWCNPSQDPPSATEAAPKPADPLVEAGRRIYRDGVLPSGELMSGRVLGDVSIKGNQVICDTCHRRSGMGATEGQEVVPAITGDILFEPLRLPTSQPDLAPILRPAYTDELLRRAIRDGIGSNGEPLGGFMPRYVLSDADMDGLIAYLKSLDSSPAPGVTDTDMHFATIVSDDLDASTRKALLDVLQKYFERKNAGTRHETQRAANAPWHKEWLFKPYRKWKLHVWELTGPRETWGEQLARLYAQQPVFAVVSGVVNGSWRPVHDFCEHNQVPCLFPTTDLPVVDEMGFYSVYFSAGMALEARAIAHHMDLTGGPTEAVVEVFQAGDPRAVAAAGFMQQALQRTGVAVIDRSFEASEQGGADAWVPILQQAAGKNLVLWLDGRQLTGLWGALSSSGTPPKRIYLSSTLYDISAVEIPDQWRQHVYVVHPYAMPDDSAILLARSRGWLLVNKIYAPDEQRVQANTFFALKAAGEAAKAIRGYFNREYLIERIEHMLDNATYTAMYPSASLAPGQRFISKGAYIGQFSTGAEPELNAVSDWIIP